jgi:hypothetical protein
METLNGVVEQDLSPGSRKAELSSQVSVRAAHVDKVARYVAPALDFPSRCLVGARTVEEQAEKRLHEPKLPFGPARHAMIGAAVCLTLFTAVLVSRPEPQPGIDGFFAPWRSIQRYSWPGRGEKSVYSVASEKLPCSLRSGGKGGGADFEGFIDRNNLQKEWVIWGKLAVAWPGSVGSTVSLPLGDRLMRFWPLMSMAGVASCPERPCGQMS